MIMKSERRKMGKYLFSILLLVSLSFGFAPNSDTNIIVQNNYKNVTVSDGIESGVPSTVNFPISLDTIQFGKNLDDLVPIWVSVRSIESPSSYFYLVDCSSMNGVKLFADVRTITQRHSNGKFSTYTQLKLWVNPRDTYILSVTSNQGSTKYRDWKFFVRYLPRLEVKVSKFANGTKFLHEFGQVQ